MKRLLSMLLALCLACGLVVLPAATSASAEAGRRLTAAPPAKGGGPAAAVKSEPAAAAWTAIDLFDAASGVSVRVETQGAALDWRLYVSEPTSGCSLVLLTTGDGRTAEQIAASVPVRLTVTVPGEPWVYHAVPGEPAVTGPEGVPSYGLVGMNVDELMVLNGASVAWAAPAGWLPDAYWERHKHGEAAVLDEPEESQSALPTARQPEAAQPPDDDANPNTGL